MRRRMFLGSLGITAGLPFMTSNAVKAKDAAEKLVHFSTPKDVQRGEMRFRTLGRTGVEVSMVGIGGFHIGKVSTEDESVRIIRTAVDAGVNFMDNSWDYNKGSSEERMGKALRDGYRDKVFLMTKIDGRTKSSATKQLEESLKRLQTDHLDLLQIHEVIRLEDPDRCFAPDGVIEAVIAAQRSGKTKYIGFTGHKDPLVHLRMLDTAKKHNFAFDTVQMPLNVMDAHFRSFRNHVLPVLVKEKIGVLGMKPLASGKILESKTATAIDCLRYAMSLPTSTVITGIDSMEILKQALELVKNFKPLTEAEESDLLARTSMAASDGRFEAFKTTPVHDSTAQHPEWLG
jgi:predicted aldo/keto reductase-like oxidoreductase